MSEEFSLNSRDNLNPDMELIKDEISKGKYPPLPKIPNKPLPPMPKYFPSAHEIKTYQKVKPFFPDGTRRLSEEEKESYIKKFEENKTAKSNGIRAIDETKDRPIKKKKYNLLMVLSVLGVISLFGFLTIGGVFAYLAWNDGTLKDTFICPDLNINENAIKCESAQCPACPEVVIPACPEPADVRVYCGNQTT